MGENSCGRYFRQADDHIGTPLAGADQSLWKSVAQEDDGVVNSQPRSRPAEEGF
jgi:hypothetical protein